VVIYVAIVTWEIVDEAKKLVSKELASFSNWWLTGRKNWFQRNWRLLVTGENRKPKIVGEKKPPSVSA